MLRIDRDGDGVINFRDFKDMLFLDYFKIYKKADLEIENDISEAKGQTGKIKTIEEKENANSIHKTKTNSDKLLQFSPKELSISDEIYKTNVSILDSFGHSPSRNKLNSNKELLTQSKSYYSPKQTTAQDSDFLPASQNCYNFSKVSTLITTSEILARFLSDISRLEVEIESIKESLSLRHDIFLREIFYWFDYTNRGFFDKKDFREVLNDLGIEAHLYLQNRVFDRFNLGNNNRMS